MIKRIAVIVLAAFTLVIPFLPTPKASAATADYLPQCGDTYLDRWNWPADLRGEAQGGYTDTTAELPGFNSASSSYFIIQTSDERDFQTVVVNGQTKSVRQNKYTIFFSSGELTISVDNNAPYNQTEILISSNGLVQSATLVSEPQNVDRFKGMWGGAYGSGVRVYQSNNTSEPYHPHILTSEVYCAYAAKNVHYDGAFSALYNNFSDHVEYGEYNTSCKLTDLGCILSKAYHGIESAFQAVGMAIVQAIGYLFAPDKDQLNNLWQEFYNFMQAKLGLLLYPFTFINNVFNAFTSGSSWCNSSSCSKNFGNLFGHAFTVNLKQAQDTMPTLWTWFTGMIRGLTIVALLLAVRQKYRGVTSK